MTKLDERITCVFVCAQMHTQTYASFLYSHLGSGIEVCFLFCLGGSKLGMPPVWG